MTGRLGPPCVMVLTPKTRMRWRGHAHQLDAELVRALIAEGDEREGLLLAWVASKEPTTLEDKKLQEAIVGFIVDMRKSLLQELLQRYIALKDRDSGRIEDIHRAAQAFQREFEALVAA